MENKKMKRVAGNLEICTKVLKWMFLAGTIVCIVLALLILIFGKDMIDNYSVTLGELTIYFNDTVPVNEKLVIAQSVVELVIAGILLLGLSFSMKIFYSIVKPIKEGRPFGESITKDLRKLAWTSLVIGGLGEVIKLVGSIFTNATFDFEELFVANYVESMEYNYEFDLTFLVVFGAIMFLSFIFQYGQQLQKESDETL